MAMRMSGLMSGMDTETIIKELVSAKQTKVDDAKKAQTKLQWKQETKYHDHTQPYKTSSRQYAAAKVSKQQYHQNQETCCEIH